MSSLAPNGGRAARWEKQVAVVGRVSATVTGHRRWGVREHDLVLELPPGPMSARRLIETAVTAEVAAFQARAEEAGLVRVLTEKSLLESLERGAVRPGSAQHAAGEAPGPVAAGGAQVKDAAVSDAAVSDAAVSTAVRTALLAFEDGIFKVFVDDDELTSDGEVEVADGAALLFLRLVPLAGG